MITSCGFLIESNGLVLLCHATNGFKKPLKNDFKYGIPKGQIDSDETFMDTAIRELREETGLDLLDLPHSIKVSLNYATIVYKSGKKTLKVFKVVDDTGILLKFPFVCNSMFEYKGKALPEIDSFLWVSYDVAKSICIKGQRELFDIDRQQIWKFNE
jgi:8-oxo-dGTP pyrophosphatase MutT (NUDIX family)